MLSMGTCHVTLHDRNATRYNCLRVHLASSMPTIDTRLGVYIKDEKPVRLCRWRDCPLQDDGYEGVKMKMCARCHFVRYCSKECQKSDWKLHKQGCRTPRFVDIGSWVKAYEWLIEWAAREALQIHTHPDKILTHCLVINVFAVERVVGPIASPFLIVNAQVLNTTKETLTTGNDVEASLAIRESGGIGQAQVVIQYHSLGGSMLLRPERLAFRDRPLSKSELEEYEHFERWEEVLKGIGNGTMMSSEMRPRRAELDEVD